MREHIHLDRSTHAVRAAGFLTWTQVDAGHGPGCQFLQSGGS